MLRPYTDIGVAVLSNPIKNGSCIIGSTPTGRFQTLNTNVKNTPIIAEIYNKYGNRFYNGILVYMNSSGIVEIDGGASETSYGTEINGQL